MHGDRFDAHFAAGADHPQRNLAAVGDQDLFENRLGCSPHSMIIRGAPYSTGLPSSTSRRLTVPARGAGMWFIVFIASMIRTVWPSATVAPMVDERRRARFGRQIDRAHHGRGHGTRDAGPDRPTRPGPPLPLRARPVRVRPHRPGPGLHGHDIRLLDHAHLKAVILAIFALDRKFGQLVLVQKLGKRLDEGHVGVGECLLMPSSFWVTCGHGTRQRATLGGRTLVRACLYATQAVLKSTRSCGIDTAILPKLAQAGAKPGDLGGSSKIYRLIKNRTVAAFPERTIKGDPPRVQQPAHARRGAGTPARRRPIA
jgi:hypothetical protein